MLIFETTYFDYPLIKIIISLFCFLAAFVLIVNYKVHNVLNQYYKVKLNKNILVLLCFLVGILSFLLGNPFSFIKAREAIDNLHYKEVIGNIDEFNPKGCNEMGYESFVINGVFFKYTHRGMNNAFYSKTKCNDGFITNNGQKVKIYYLTINGQNKIIKMWLEKP